MGKLYALRERENSMRQAEDTITVKTRGPGLTDISGEVAEIIRASRVSMGLVTVFCTHTSASLLIQENADPAVQRDLVAFFRRIVPEGDPLFSHTTEGPDDMPAHVKTALTQTSLSIPISSGRMVLGIWQGIYLFEHRADPHTRQVVVHVIGE
jgi:secondary thiamine-phosphate synthase enzyme